MNVIRIKNAIIIIAPRSSIIAKAVKKTFKEIGTLDPNKDKTPNEKAMSVAEGIAQPFSVIGVWYIYNYIN